MASLSHMLEAGLFNVDDKAYREKLGNQHLKYKGENLSRYATEKKEEMRIRIKTHDIVCFGLSHVLRPGFQFKRLLHF